MIQGESKERRGEGWVIEITPALMIIVLLGNSVCIFSCPFLTIHSNSTSNMANCTNDCKLVTLTFPTKTPALQANLLPVKSMSSDGSMTSFFSIWNKHALSQSTRYMSTLKTPQSLYMDKTTINLNVELYLLCILESFLPIALLCWFSNILYMTGSNLPIQCDITKPTYKVRWKL